MIRGFHLADFLTLGNAACGTISIFAAMVYVDTRHMRALVTAMVLLPLGLVLDVLDGYELAAGAWEGEVLPSRLAQYDPLWLDGLCLSGEIVWGRLTATRSSDAGTRNRKVGPIRSTPIALFRRERGEIWRAGIPEFDPADLLLSSTGKALLAAFDQRGALFFGDLVNGTGLLRTEVEKGLGELVAWGLVASDSFAGLRALLVPSDRRRPIGVGAYRRRGRIAQAGEAVRHQRVTTYVQRHRVPRAGARRRPRP